MAKRKIKLKDIHKCNYCNEDLTNKRKSQIFFDEEGNEYCNSKCYNLKKD